jgi:hypothetical protein
MVQRWRMVRALDDLSRGAVLATALELRLWQKGIRQVGAGALLTDQDAAMRAGMASAVEAVQ